MSHRGARGSASSLSLVTLAVLVPSWMALIDGTVVNVGLDTIAGNLGVSLDEATWISSIYVLAAVFVMPLTGWLAANLGRKRSFVIAVWVFTIASVLCAMSSTLAELAIMRFAQGVGGGLILPLAMAALVDAYPPEKLGAAFKTYGVAVMVGPALGPALGGWILANATWPWIFLLNVPLGIASLFLIASVLPEHSEAGERSRFDWLSLAVMIAGFTALQYVVQEGPRQQWLASGSVSAALAIAVLALGVFVRMQLASPVPLVDFRPLAIPAYAIAMVIAFITGIAFTGCLLIVPLYTQEVLRFGPDTAGLIMVPAALGTIIGTELSGRADRRIPASIVAAFSLVIAAAGTLWFAYLGDRPGFDHALAPRFLQGFGVGLLYVPLNVLMMSRVPKRLVDAASGFGALVRQVSTGFGFALLSSLVVQNRIAATSLTAGRFHAAPAVNGFGFVSAQQWFAEHGYSAADASRLSVAVVQQLLARAATSIAYSETFVVMAALFVIAIPCLLLFHLVPNEETRAA